MTPVRVIPCRSNGMLLLRRLPAVFAALILFALIVAAAADARPLTGSPAPTA